MGLDASCNDIHVKCGSYDRVSSMHQQLLIGLKFYIEYESIMNEEKKVIVIDILEKMLQDKNELYRELNYNHFKKHFFSYDLDGFFPFLAIKDQGHMTSYESKRFLKTLKIVKDYLHLSLLQGGFVLKNVFRESIKTDEDVQFF